MRNFLGVGWVLSLALAGCSKPPPSMGSLVETKPPSLGTGVVVQQPAEGDALEGQWVAVSGWFDTATYQGVLVTGAEVAEYYAPTGHVGLPTVPVTLRKDGFFVAPRVPLVDGEVTLAVIPLQPTGKAGEPVLVKVKASKTNVIPATLVAEPDNGPPDTKVTFRASVGTQEARNWQWDFEDDGTFEVEAPSPSHTYGKEGHYEVLARTKIAGRWVYAAGGVAMFAGGEATHSSTEVTAPKLLTVIEPTFREIDEEYVNNDDGMVLVADGTKLKMFSQELKLLRAIDGFGSISGLTVDSKRRIYVADGIKNRVSRYLASGTLDASFADAGHVSSWRPTPRRNCNVSGCQWDLGTASSIGTPKAIYVTDDHVRVLADGWFQCQPTKPSCEKTIPDHGMTTVTSFRLGSSDTIFVFRPDGTWGVGLVGQFGEKEPRRARLDIVDICGDNHDPFSVIIDTKAVLHEFDGDSELRKTQLSFQPSTIGFDRRASIELGSGAALNERGHFKKVVYYFAGPGRIERRVFRNPWRQWL